MKRITFLIIILTMASFANAQTKIKVSNDQSNPDSVVFMLLNKPMPYFSANDIKKVRYDTKKFINKVVFINFWFLDCSPCMEELGQLSTLYNTYRKDTNVVFISICFNKPTDIKSFISKDDTTYFGGKVREHYKKFAFFNNSISYPIISSTNKQIEEKFKVNGWPTSFIIDKKGVIRLINVGAKIDDANGYLVKMYGQKINDLLHN